MENITRIRGEQITLATAATFATMRGIPPGFNAVDIEVISSTIEVVTVGLGPRIRKVYFYDASRVGAARWRDFSEVLTDRNTASLMDVSEIQTDDRIYVGAVDRYEGVSIDVTGTNGAGTAAMVGEYPNGNVWTDLSITDGTFSTRTLAQDGLVTWTVPTTFGWQAKSLKEVADEGVAGLETDKLFWTRFRVDAAVTDTSVTIVEMTALFNDALNVLTPNNEGQDEIRIVTTNSTKPPYRLYLDTERYGSIELVSASITSAANLNWLVLR